MSTIELSSTTAYMRDKFVPFADANLSIASSPVLYGLSIYTVCGATWNAQSESLTVFRLRDHYDRLRNSAKIMDFHSFADDWTYEKFEVTVFELLRKNEVKENVLIRITVYIDELSAGTKIHDLKNSVSMYCYPLGELLPRTGIAAMISSWQRTADNAIPSRAKVNGSYVNAALMKNEALLNGYDEAIALDQHGHVSEGTVANLFMVRGGTLITPGAATDILEGITRDSVIKIALADGIKVQERSIDRSEIYLADEIFMCGSSAVITPVLSVDRRIIGDGKPGPLSQKLTQLYASAQRGDYEKCADWVQKVQ